MPPPFAPRPQLQLRFRSLRKINCTFANAPAQKAAWWAAMCHAGFAPKVLALLLSKEIASALIAGVIVVMADWKKLRFRSTAKSIALSQIATA